MAPNRAYDFIVGPETSTLPAVADPSAAEDFVILSYANKTYTRGVADLTALKAIAAAGRTDLQSVYVRSLDALFQFVSASSATSNDISVVTPSAGTGRWLRVKDADRDSWYDTQANPTAVKAIDAIERVHGQVVFVQSLQKLFWFDSASSASGDDVTVITPTSGTGRWLQTAAAAVSNKYAAVVANPAISGFSTHTTISSAITAVSAGAVILVTAGTYTETVTINKQLTIEGVGYASIVSGNVSVTSVSDFSTVTGLKITGTVTLDSGATGNRFTECYLDTLASWVDNDGSNFFDGVEF